MATKSGQSAALSATAQQLRRRNQMRWLIMLAVPLAFLLTFYVYPMARMLARSFWDPEFTLKHYIQFFQMPAYMQVLTETFKMGFSVTIICLLMGYPVAYLLSTVTPRVRNMLMVMVALPFLTAILVRTYAWMVILGQNGLLNHTLLASGILDSPLRLMHNLFGVHVGMVQILLPFMILPLFSVMEGIERSLLKAAENLGASPSQAFLRVFLPLSLPGVGGGCLLVFIISLGFFITPALMGGVSDVMISMFIETQVNTLLNWGFASAMAVILLVITLVLFSIYTRFFGVDKTFGRS